jgi:hypothetical protein
MVIYCVSYFFVVGTEFISKYFKLVLIERLIVKCILELAEMVLLIFRNNIVKSDKH